MQSKDGFFIDLLTSWAQPSQPDTKEFTVEVDGKEHTVTVTENKK